MGHAQVAVRDLPEAAIDAAQAFYERSVPQVRALLARQPERPETITVILPPADHDHRAWRIAAVQDLAREAAPTRINAVVGDSPAVDAAVAFLSRAPGITGQVLVV